MRHREVTGKVMGEHRQTLQKHRQTPQTHNRSRNILSLLLYSHRQQISLETAEINAEITRDSRVHSGDHQRQQRSQQRSLETAEITAEITRDIRVHSGDHQKLQRTQQRTLEIPENTLRHRGDIRYTPPDIGEVGNNHIHIGGDIGTGNRTQEHTSDCCCYSLPPFTTSTMWFTDTD